MSEMLKNVKKTSKAWQFKEGNPGGPGRPKGSLNKLTKFRKAIELFEKEQGKDIYHIILEKALRSPTILVAIFKALIPRPIESEVDVTPIYNPYEKMTDEELIEEFEQDLNQYKKIIAKNLK